MKVCEVLYRVASSLALRAILLVINIPYDKGTLPVSMPAAAMHLETSTSAMNVEIEMKFQVLAEPAIEKFVNTLTFLGKKHVVDVYLGTPTANLCKRRLGNSKQ